MGAVAGPVGLSSTLWVGLVAAVLVAVLTPLVRRYAVSRGLVEAATSSRKIHTGAIPRVGGIAMAFALCATLMVSLILEGGLLQVAATSLQPIATISLAALVIVLIGVFDDLGGVRARYKLLVQTVAGILVYVSGLGLSSAELLPGLSFGLGPLAPLVTVLWVVGVINAINLIDGMDGLAGGLVLIASAALAALAVARGDYVGAMLAAAVAGVTLGFLLYNWHPASIFMGDTGSMLLGLSLSVVALRVTRTEAGATPLLVCGFIVAVPILDTSLAFTRRLLVGRSPFSADKDHLHHRLLERFGLGQRQTVIVLHLVAIGLAVLGIAAADATLWGSAALVALGVALLGTLVVRLGYVSGWDTELRRRNAALNGAVKQALQSVRGAETVPAIWAGIEPLAEALGTAKLELHCDTPAGGLVFNRLRNAGNSDPMLVQVPLRVRTLATGKLVAIWRDGRTQVDRDQELALEAAAHRVARALRRLEREGTGPQAAAAGLVSQLSPVRAGSTEGELRDVAARA